MSTSKKHIAFFGTPDFTRDFLDVLETNGYSPSLVVTNPDRPRGRGMAVAAPAPKIWADEHHVHCLQPEKLGDEFFATFSATSWDICIVIAYGKILPERIITLPAFGTINIHYSLLPRYRGATPVESALLHGDTTTGVTIQQMTYELDAGDILASREIPIDPDDTTPTLREKLNREALLLLPDTLGAIFEGTARGAPQDATRATKCTKLSKRDGELDLSDDPVTNDRKYRAYYDWPGSYFFATRRGARIRVKIAKAHLAQGNFIIDEVIPENGKRMTYQEYQRWVS